MNKKETKMADKTEQDEAIEVEAEVINAEVTEPETTGKSSSGVTLALIALIVGLVVGPFIQTLLTPYLPAALQPVAVPTNGNSQILSALARRTTRLETAAAVAAKNLDGLAQQVRELRAAEASRAGDTATREQSGELTALEDRLQSGLAETKAALDRVARQVEQMAGQANSATAEIDVDGLQARLNALETNMIKLTGELQQAARQAREMADDAVAPLGDDIKDLSQKVEAMAAEAANRVAAVQKEAFAIALVQLRVAIDKGRSFANVLAAIGQRFGGQTIVDEALKTLNEHADEGVKNIDALQSEFPEVIRLVLHGSDMAAPGFWDTAKQKLANLVTVRRTGAIDGDSAEAILARAEHALNDGDLTVAVAEIESLDAAAQAKAAPWLDDAKARIAVEAAMDTLEQQALAGAGAG